MWLRGLHYESVQVHSEPGEVRLDTGEAGFGVLVAGFHGIIGEVLVIEGLLEVPIYACEVGV